MCVNISLLFSALTTVSESENKTKQAEQVCNSTFPPLPANLNSVATVSKWYDSPMHYFQKVMLHRDRNHGAIFTIKRPTIVRIGVGESSIGDIVRTTVVRFGATQSSHVGSATSYNDVYALLKPGAYGIIMRTVKISSSMQKFPGDSPSCHTVDFEMSAGTPFMIKKSMPERFKTCGNDSPQEALISGQMLHQMRYLDRRWIPNKDAVPMRIEFEVKESGSAMRMDAFYPAFLWLQPSITKLPTSHSPSIWVSRSIPLSIMRSGGRSSAAHRLSPGKYVVFFSNLLFIDDYLKSPVFSCPYYHLGIAVENFKDPTGHCFIKGGVQLPDRLIFDTTRLDNSSDVMLRAEFSSNQVLVPQESITLAQGKKKATHFKSYMRLILPQQLTSDVLIRTFIAPQPKVSAQLALLLETKDTAMSATRPKTEKLQQEVILKQSGKTGEIVKFTASCSDESTRCEDVNSDKTKQLVLEIQLSFPVEEDPDCPDGSSRFFQFYVGVFNKELAKISTSCPSEKALNLSMPSTLVLKDNEHISFMETLHIKDSLSPNDDEHVFHKTVTLELPKNAVNGSVMLEVLFSLRLLNLDLYYQSTSPDSSQFFQHGELKVHSNAMASLKLHIQNLNAKESKDDLRRLMMVMSTIPAEWIKSGTHCFSVSGTIDSKMSGAVQKQASIVGVEPSVFVRLDPRHPQTINLTTNDMFLFIDHDLISLVKRGTSGKNATLVSSSAEDSTASFVFVDLDWNSAYDLVLHNKEGFLDRMRRPMDVSLLESNTYTFKTLPCACENDFCAHGGLCPCSSVTAMCSACDGDLVKSLDFDGMTCQVKEEQAEPTLEPTTMWCFINGYILLLINVMVMGVYWLTQLMVFMRPTISDAQFVPLPADEI